MPVLFEYGEWNRSANAGDLKNLLREVWAQRLFVSQDNEEDVELSEDAADSRYQPFLNFDSAQIRANNYVGFIQNGDELIEIFPKVFRALFRDGPVTGEHKALMLRHIFYWLDYCRRWKFPFSQADLDTVDIDSLPELIINRIANQFLETVSNQPLTIYQPVEEALRTPRGSINFKRYLTNGFATGNQHIIDCDHEPFLFDNRVNRIIKYCSRLLMSQSRFSENIAILQNVVFVLDDVEDVPCTVSDIERVSLNPFFGDYQVLMDHCRMILGQQIYSSSIFELSQWCLLFPMEYIFEDFIAGFLESKFRTDWKVEYQKSNAFLSDDPRVFMMQHDIFLTSRADTDRKIIIDTKYKLRDRNFKNDRKKGIAQADLYQMVSYALKRGCTELILLYPNISEELNAPDTFKVISGFDGKDTIVIHAAEVPFWSFDDFDGLADRLCSELTGLLSAADLVISDVA